MPRGSRRLTANRMLLALALVSAGPPLVIHDGWRGFLVAVPAAGYAAYLVLGKRWPRLRRRPRPAAPAGPATPGPAAAGFEAPGPAAPGPAAFGPAAPRSATPDGPAPGPAAPGGPAVTEPGVGDFFAEKGRPGV
ncbi:hypothetical protein ACQP2F_31400 [Actinoplanes sp. CA-030573]|uniref:hypothetical protein n=1 Tax=Actinoplanes sp. CA-030573 TaxID=3239898 RepID=UPI003D8C31A0